MKLTLSENIKALRKERKMTQEQLAEALGVTVGAVHKWESRASMPEIRLLIEMADLFCVSVDALLGYAAKSSGVEDVIERINAYLRAKEYSNAISEADKALLRYPNNFRIVSCCADAYGRKGLETGETQALQRAIELMERSIPLLSQNDDAQISEVTIRSDIATCYIVQGQTDKGLEILERYNSGGINNSLLGLTYSQEDHFSAPKAEKYLMQGLGDVVINVIRCMSGYANYYIRTGNLNGALETAQWTVGFLGSLKQDSSSVCYFDKIIATFSALGAAMLLLLGRQEESNKMLMRTYMIAGAFDSCPVYNVSGIRFTIGDTKNAAVSDDLGETAVTAVEKMLASDERCRPALEQWRKIMSEYKEEPGNE